MKIYEYSPIKNVKKLGMITGALLLGASILMLTTFLFGEMPYRWSIQLLSILMLVVSIFITSRYIMKSFVYAIIKNDDDSLDLTVTEIQGRHVITVCRIALDTIEQITVIDQGEKEKTLSVKEKIRTEKRKSFNYRSDLLDEKHICIFTTESGTPLAIKLSHDDRLTDILTPHV